MEDPIYQETSFLYQNRENSARWIVLGFLFLALGASSFTAYSVYEQTGRLLVWRLLFFWCGVIAVSPVVRRMVVEPSLEISVTSSKLSVVLNRFPFPCRREEVPLARIEGVSVVQLPWWARLGGRDRAVALSTTRGRWLLRAQSPELLAASLLRAKQAVSVGLAPGAGPS